MELEINQKKQIFPVKRTAADTLSEEPLSLEKLMEELYPEGSDGMAVALHNQVIARVDWAVTFLKDADKLLILTATQGG